MKKSTVTMNIFLPKKQFLLLFIFFSCLSLRGQQIDTLVYAQPEEIIEYSFVQFRGLPIGLKTIQLPSNGQLIGPELIGDSTEIYQYTYQSNPGFLGQDIFAFTRLTCFDPGVCIDTVYVGVEVREPQVQAQQDIAFAKLNSEGITIDVVANDYSEEGALSILNIPMVNNGIVSITPDNKINFQPAPGFEGIASFNYNVCNEFGICDLTTVSVVVNEVLPNQEDTLRIYTSLNEPTPIIMPKAYTLVNNPDNGTLDNFSQEVPYYYPNQDFSGKDYLSFTYGDYTQNIEITVLGIAKNQFLKDDRVYITPGESVEIDVFANDDYEENPCLLQSFGQPKYGSWVLDETNPGRIIYQAPNGFVGVDEFQYTAKAEDCDSQAETAKVSIFISNYEPASSKYAMSTPKMTPLVIGYYVPIKGFNLEVKQKPRSGSVIFLEGEVDTLIYDRHITGSNLMIYWPSDQMTSGTDDFEITYCLKGNGNSNGNGLGLPSSDGTLNLGSSCAYQKDVKITVDILDIGNGEIPLCFGDCIWSGDTNFDGQVNLEDLLPIGLQMGGIGVKRDDLDFDGWYGQDGLDWTGNADPALKNKHIDTDGDSFISASDTVAIRNYYGRTHSMTNAKIPNYDYQVFLKGNSIIRPGQPFELDIYIGSESAPALDLYGFTLNLPYNPRFFDADLMEIEFSNDAWIGYNSPTLNMSHNNGKGRLSAAYTRTNKLSISGFGKVGVFRGGVEDFIEGIKDGDGIIEIDLSEILAPSATNGNGASYGLKVAPFILSIDLGKEKEDEQAEAEEDFEPIGSSDLNMFPNPTKDRLNFQLNSKAKIEKIEIIDLAGRIVIADTNVADQFAQISLANLNDGLYLAKIYSDRGVISKKVKVLK